MPEEIAIPDITGRGLADDGGKTVAVVFDWDDVVKIEQYVKALKARAEKIKVILEGHIEKLENRIKAVNGGK